MSLPMPMAIYQHKNKIVIFQITASRCIRVRYTTVQDGIFLVHEYGTKACPDMHMVLDN